MKFKQSVLSLVLAGLLSACGGGSSGGGDGTPDPIPEPPQERFDYQALLQNLGENVILPTFTSFRENTVSLLTQMDNYCAALGTEAELINRENAQNAWREAMSTWQQVEMMQIGPLVENNSVLRDNIYSWDIVSTCAVDQDVIYFRNNDIGNGEIYDIELRQPNRKGLAALEYLLFNDSLEHTCSPQVVVTQSWAELSDTEKQVARCEFASLVSENLQSNANSLVAKWSTGPDNFLDKLVSAGESGSVFSSFKEALNAVSDALFYIDSKSKDMKLAKPLGFTSNSCGGERCEQDLESQYALVSKENIANNLLALQHLFLGNRPGEAAGLGFDDLLVAIGESNLASTMSTDIQTAIDAAQGVDGTLKSALTDDASSIETIHSDIKVVTDQMKLDFIEKLELELPATSAGDND